MSLSEDFAAAQEKAGTGSVTFYPANAGTSLSFQQAGRYSSHYCTYHFLTRTMTMSTGHNEGGITVVPFAQLDREVLEFMHAKLVELGGHPPALPQADGTPLSPIRKNNP